MLPLPPLPLAQLREIVPPRIEPALVQQIDRHAVPAPAIEHPRTRLQLRQIEIENPPPRPLDFELQPFQMLARQRSRLIKPVVIRPLGEIDDAVIDGITARAVRT